MNETAQTHQNPFMQPYGTPHDTVPFGRITLADYEEAFVEGIRRDDEEIDRIVNDPEEPTFDNTIIRTDTDRGEHYYDLLDRVSNAFSCLLSAETSDEMDALAERMSPLLSKHASDVSLNEGLFRRVQRVWEHHRELTGEEEMLLRNAYDGFRRSGALLPPEGKERLRAISEEASLLSLKFSQNLRAERTAYTLHITSEQQLDGLPDTAREAARHEAQERGLEGWVFTLDQPSYSPFLTYATDRELRRQIYTAYSTLCCREGEHGNMEVCRRLVDLRREMAQLLGYDTFADYMLEHRMAGSKEGVYRLLHQLTTAYKPSAVSEIAELQDKARQTQGEDFCLQPWDISYYSHQLKKERYQIDAEMLRPYLKLDRVTDGVFGLATRLYGITFRPNPEIPVYHPDVKAYEVYDGDGRYLAVLYADFHPRKGKQGGAWMTEFQGQWIDRKGNNVRPHVSLVMNLTKPTDGKPALLTLDEVETFLHEFGHALHGIFADTRFQSLSGTNVWWDFVELPSQFMENYTTEKEFLHTFARHWQTGEPIPDALIDRTVSARNFMAGHACLRQVSFALLDMAYYTLTGPLTGDIHHFEQQAWAEAAVTRQLPEATMTPQFSHIMAGGYAAGYYSYKWAEVLDADAFSVFRREGIFNADTARRFRDCILSRGGTEHPMTLYKRFRGGEPTIDALLKRDGIKQQLLDLRYLRMARIWAENSYCQRRKVGALVVKDKMIISDGYNGTPSGFENVCEDGQGLTKPYVLHAEANAITKLARSGNNSDGSTLYVTASPCIECAKLIIQAGIKRVVYGEKYRLDEGIRLLQKAGIEVIYLSTDNEEKPE